MQTASMRLRHFPDDDDDDDVVIHDLAGCEADGFEGHVETFASLLPCLEWHFSAWIRRLSFYFDFCHCVVVTPCTCCFTSLILSFLINKIVRGKSTSFSVPECPGPMMF